MSSLPRSVKARAGDRRATIAARLRGIGASTGIKVDSAQAIEDGSTPSASANVTAELWLYGVVGGCWFGFDSDDVAWALKQMPADITDINVRLHSPGGSAPEGIAIGNLLSNHSARVRVVVDGLAASAASIIALGGDEVVMSPGAMFMIHEASLCTCGNAAQLRSDADFIDKISRNYSEVYAYRAGGSAEQWRQAMLADNGDGTWYTAQEAVTAGLAQSIGNIAAAGTPPAEPDLDPHDADAMARAAFDLDVLVPAAARAAWASTGADRASRHLKPPSASAVGSTHTKKEPT